MFLHNSFRSPRHQQFGIVFTSLWISALAIAPASAQSTQAKVQEILDGNQVFIQNKRANINDVATQRQQVRTGASRASLQFNTGAVARLSSNSVLNIGQCARLRRGTILINGAVNACSASITTGVRGTTYLLEVDESGNQQVKVLEGEVIVKRNAQPINDDSDITDAIAPPTSPKAPNSKIKGTYFTTIAQVNAPPSTSNTQPLNLPSNDPLNAKPLEPLNAKPVNDQPILRVEQGMEKPPEPPQDEVILKSGEKVEIDQQGSLGIVQQLTENEFVGLLTGSLFQGFTNQIPGINKVRDAFSGLFPNIDFPISLPGLPTPSIPIPNIPGLPF
ncbi:MAG: FecR family protein [Pseudanabaenaceae cyanobacterium bins.39]|nr:FecR family protein [Pseudanabaenaceae cyanobacterium bins.39]